MGVGGAAFPTADSGAATSAISLGRAGEEAVGIAANVPKVDIRIPGTSTIRYPDRLTQTALDEVKNVSKHSYTQQLRDYAAYALSTDRIFNLFVRPTTVLSPLSRRQLRQARST
ncbi:MAG: hypothetical protein IT563_22855 [Alphaproteobacteria bacterium]|nr:hypothetical protein [Alphaproteobacteria bacterium]